MTKTFGVLGGAGLIAAVELIFCAGFISAQMSSHSQLEKMVEVHAPNYIQVSKQIWDYAELGYHENKSSTLLQMQLKDAGFKMQTGVADEPTGFIASYGRGKPVIAILGEFDALPGLSQQSLPQRDPVVSGAAGHACGHNLLGARCGAGSGCREGVHGEEPCGGDVAVLRDAGRRGWLGQGVHGA